MAHVEFTYAGASPATLTATGTFHCYGFLPLYSVGPNRGGNLLVGGASGRKQRDRVRDQLDVTLRWKVGNATTIAGAAGDTDRVRQARLNWRALNDWFDAAPAGEVTVTLVDGDVSWSGPATHEKFDEDPEWHGFHVKSPHLLTIAAGALTLVEESSS